MNLRRALTLLLLLISTCGVATEVAAKERSLNVARASTKVTTVDSYFRQYTYGDTLRFYHFTDQDAVLKLRFPNNDANFELDGSLNLFSTRETSKSIKKWINNQYSDALFSDAPQPTRVVPVVRYTILSAQLVNSETGGDGYVYDNYRLQFFVDSMSKSGEFHLANFTDSVLVHVRTSKAGSAERLLDVSSTNVKATTISSYFSPLKYGDTLKFYHFTDKNAVLMLRFPNSDANFEIIGSINVFSDLETEAGIATWINNQYSDALFPGAPAPTNVVPIDPTQYHIIASALLGTETGAAGDTYDNYRVEFFVDAIFNAGVVSLANFADNVIVHVRNTVAPPPTTNLALNVQNPNTVATTIPGYLSPGHVIPTIRAYHFVGQNAVLTATCYNINGNFRIIGAINLFASGESAAAIDQWIANLSSAVALPAPQPIAVLPTGPVSFGTISNQLIGRTPGTLGVDYEDHDVTFEFRFAFQSGNVSLAPFTSNITVPVPVLGSTTTLTTPPENVLDLHGIDTAVISYPGYLSVRNFGALRIHHFKGKNIVLMLRYPKTATGFEITGTINVFATSETTASVSQWIDNQLSDVSSPSPEPVLVLPILPSQYTINGSQYTGTTTAFYIYELYNVDYALRGIELNGFFDVTDSVDTMSVAVPIGPAP